MKRKPAQEVAELASEGLAVRNQTAGLNQS